MDRYGKLTEATVALLRSKAEAYDAVRVALDAAHHAATMAYMEGLDGSEALLLAIRALPVLEVRYPPVKRWAGGEPDLDAWYWDYGP